MKPKKATKTKRYLTDSDRDAVLRLIGCGLTSKEIADTLRISISTVSYVRQAHNACLKTDWSALQKLSTVCRSTVDWAMKVTGTDKVFTETFGEPGAQDETTEPEPVAPSITKEDISSLQNTLQDICYLLTEIRDLLK